MNPIMKFYATILTYLQTSGEVDGAIEKILNLAQEASPRWEATEESLKALEQFTNRPSELTGKEYNESTAQEDFVVAAFKDLSVLKWPMAMDLFANIREALKLPAGDSFIWARSVKKRPDGSAVVILHVSNLKQFTGIIENCDTVHGYAMGERSLADCVLIGT